jgi:hypothetical protein
MSTPAQPNYFRRDQSAGITAPDLTKVCSPAEHIVHARGKRTNFTSVSLHPSRIEDFGEVTYVLEQTVMAADYHVLIKHQELVDGLRATCRNGEKAERTRALQALRHAMRRSEGLVDWKFDTSRVERSDMITWGYGRVQKYFRKV